MYKGLKIKPLLRIHSASTLVKGKLYNYWCLLLCTCLTSYASKDARCWVLNEAMFMSAENCKMLAVLFSLFYGSHQLRDQKENPVDEMARSAPTTTIKIVEGVG